MTLTPGPPNATPIGAAADIVQFRLGLPGFVSQRRFVLTPDSRNPLLIHLRSLDSDLRLMLVPAPAIDPAYELVLESWDVEALGLNGGTTEAEESRLAVYFVVSAPAGQAPTLNMLAPVVIRLSFGPGPEGGEGRTREVAPVYAVQAVRSDRRYSHAAPLRRFAHAGNPGAAC